jgi:hypothetical protein
MLVPRSEGGQDTDIAGALQINKYSGFHQLTRQPTWGDVPIGCTCKQCKVFFPNRVMHHLFASLFNQAIQVPVDFIAATVSGRKRCKTIKGTAGWKRMRIIAENKCNEKKIDSKVGYFMGTKPCESYAREPEPVIPEPVLPSSLNNDDDEIQVTPGGIASVFYIQTDRGFRCTTMTTIAERRNQVVHQGRVSASQPISALCEKSGPIQRARHPASQPA